jgi:AraC family ethanolamine operon transcriptional activator
VVTFGCVEHLRLLMRGAGIPLELTQLAGGLMQGDLLPIHLGAVRLLRVRLDRPLHIRGAKDPHQQLICLDLTPPALAGPSRSHGQLLPVTAVYGLASQGEVHLTIPAGSVVALLVIERRAFQQWCVDLGCAGLDEAALQCNWLQLDSRRFADLSCCLRGLFALAEADAGFSARPREPVPLPLSMLVRDLMPLLIEALIHGADRSSTLLRPPARIELVKQVQQWVEQNPNAPITLTDLCQVVHVSRRSLIQGFREHLGMGPMAYLKLQRLHSVRRALLRADPCVATVTAVAAEHGFFNAGHFARDYQLLFGERPSVTLRQPTPAGRLRPGSGSAMPAASMG